MSLSLLLLKYKKKSNKLSAASADIIKSNIKCVALCATITIYTRFSYSPSPPSTQSLCCVQEFEVMFGSLLNELCNILAKNQD